MYNGQALTERGSKVATRSFLGNVNAPEFPSGKDWLNTGRPISMKDLLGKIVILEFWTSC